MSACERVRRAADYWTEGSSEGGSGGGTGIGDTDKELTFLREGGQSRRGAEAGSTVLSDCKGEEGSPLALPPLGALSSEGMAGGTTGWRQNWAWQAESTCDSQHRPAPGRRARVCPSDHLLSGAGDSAHPLPAAVAPEIPGHADPAGPGTHCEDR